MDTSPFSLWFWMLLRMSYQPEQPWKSVDICRILRSAWTVQGIMLDPTHPFWVNGAKILISILLLPAGHLDWGWIQDYYWECTKKNLPTCQCLCCAFCLGAPASALWGRLESVNSHDATQDYGAGSRRLLAFAGMLWRWRWTQADRWPAQSSCYQPAAGVKRDPRLPNSQELSPPRQLNPGRRRKASITTAAGPINARNYSH